MRPRDTTPLPAIVGPWKKSSRSNQLQNLNCVEVALTTAGSSVRDSKAVVSGKNTGGQLYFSATAFAGFIGEIKSGKCDFGVVDVIG